MSTLVWLIGTLMAVGGTVVILGRPSPQGGAPGCLLMTVGGLVLLGALGVALMGG